MAATSRGGAWRRGADGAARSGVATSCGGAGWRGGRLSQAHPAAMAACGAERARPGRNAAAPGGRAGCGAELTRRPRRPAEPCARGLDGVGAVGGGGVDVAGRRRRGDSDTGLDAAAWTELAPSVCRYVCGTVCGREWRCW